MAERHSIYAGEPLANALAGWEDSRSERVNLIADAYRVFVAETTPVFEISEWCALADVANGAMLESMQSLRFFWASVADSGPDGIAEKWGVDLDALAAAVRQLPLPELLALREVLWRFWNSSDSPVETAELLRQCGAKTHDTAS